LVFDVIILYEAWLDNENVYANVFLIPNFFLYFSNLNKNKNDGVMVFIHYSITIISSDEPKPHTGLEIYLKNWNTIFLIYAIYRFPNNIIGLFIDELENLILFKTKTSKANYKLIIGDINIYLLKDTII